MPNETEVGKNWTCPHCNRPQVVLSARRDLQKIQIWNDASDFGPVAAVILTNVCANDACKKMSLSFGLFRRIREVNGFGLGEKLLFLRLLPESAAIPLPDYIPEVIRNDYVEACRIRDLSPKASATLSRRCLQGMIRDFCRISRSRLVEEIRELRSQIDSGSAPMGVQSDTIDAIDHVRSIGNIGAHMEADINVIVDVDPNEAQTLINLLELLFEEWYVARETRRQRLEAIGVVATAKIAAKNAT